MGHIVKNIFSSLVQEKHQYKDRRKIIKRIQKTIDAKLVVYISNPIHPLASIMSLDTLAFEDMLRSISNSEDGCLLINSAGGDPNAAEKLLLMCRKRFEKSFIAIVPDYAKSAATQLILGCDKILMGYLAELGPIDPQISISSRPYFGEPFPARAFIDGLEIIRRKIKKGEEPIDMYIPILSQIRPEIIALCETAIKDSEKTAENWLSKYMLKDNPKKAKEVARKLATGEEYLSHGKTIDYNEAKNILSLKVEKIDENSKLWEDIWELYCRSVLFLKDIPNATKLFESDSNSLTLQLSIVKASPQTSGQKILPKTPRAAPENSSELRKISNKE